MRKHFIKVNIFQLLSANQSCRLAPELGHVESWKWSKKSIDSPTQTRNFSLWTDLDLFKICMVYSRVWQLLWFHTVHYGIIESKICSTVSGGSSITSKIPSKEQCTLLYDIACESRSPMSRHSETYWEYPSTRWCYELVTNPGKLARITAIVILCWIYFIDYYRAHDSSYSRVRLCDYALFDRNTCRWARISLKPEQRGQSLVFQEGLRDYEVSKFSLPSPSEPLCEKS